MSPGRIRAEDLPPEVRRKLVGRAVRRAQPSTNRPTSHDDMPTRWRCRGCGKVFTAWAAAQRHGGAPQHRRIDLDLEGDT
jgi:rubredoxin